jgi:molybdenum cofactor cytidylyltransferase
MAQALAGLILAGGTGVRYGEPKAFARLPGGETFLARCAAVLVRAGAHPVVATTPPGTGGTEARDAVVVTLPAAGLDMFASLRVGLERALSWPEWQVVAVLPVDHPLVLPATVRALATVGAPAIVPVFRGKRGHPVCLSRSVATGILSGDLPGPTLREALRACGRQDLAVDDRGVTANCNTPAVLAAALTEADVR